MGEIALCSLCGEPMPEGETMFKFHGYSGPCPKAPLPKPTRLGFVEYQRRQDADGFWLCTMFNGQEHDKVGPFDTQTECDRAAEDLMQMLRDLGAKDGTRTPQ